MMKTIIYSRSPTRLLYCIVKMYLYYVQRYNYDVLFRTVAAAVDILYVIATDARVS